MPPVVVAHRHLPATTLDGSAGTCGHLMFQEAAVRPRGLRMCAVLHASPGSGPGGGLGSVILLIALARGAVLAAVAARRTDGA